MSDRIARSAADLAGRQTLRRVSGARPRLVPVLANAERPRLENCKEVRMLMWGWTGSQCASDGDAEPRVD